MDFSGLLWNSFFFHFLSSQLILCLDILIITLSGSDHRRSQSNPWSGTSVGRIIRLICSIDWRSGLNPPWQQKIFSSTMAATGRQLKQSVKVFHNLMLYLRLPEKENYKQFIYSIIIWAGCTKYMRHLNLFLTFLEVSVAAFYRLRKRMVTICKFFLKFIDRISEKLQMVPNLFWMYNKVGRF